VVTRDDIVSILDRFTLLSSVPLESTLTPRLKGGGDEDDDNDDNI
jgi:hypothetical protein